ncbi:MAG: CsbD family protein [Sphingobacteriales bacterium]|nr:CsbD family protein [Sphingobacteriales bacterium]
MKNSGVTPLVVDEKWDEQKAKLKARYGYLTEKDLHFADGKKEEMLNNLQIKLGKTKEELRKILSGL